MASSNKKSAIHVLHVDDDPSLQEITKLMLLDLDSSFKIGNACCVDEAFKKLAVGNYDVVVSDYEMPQKDGLQFLKELREQKNGIPFILFTGKGREEVAIKALNLGADAYHNKQGSPETVYGELSHSIRQSVERKKAKASISLSEMQLQCMLYINKMLDASAQELMDYALEAMTKITQSEIAFIDLLDTDETIMTIYSWSKTAMKECKTISKPIYYPISEAGILAEPIRQRKPVIIDDYSVHMPHKKGCPEGHVKIKSFLGVPVFEKEHIVAVAAVANKKGCYDETDVGHVTSLVTDMWRLIQRKKAQEEKTRLLKDLSERVKELNCIYGISKIFEKSDVVLEDALMQAVKLLPHAMQYQDITCAKIVVENQEFPTKNFKDTQWNMQADIKIHGKRVGFVEIVYLEENPTEADVPFLIEEKHLLDAIAERLGQIIEFKQADAELRGTLEILEKAGESIDAGLAVIARDYGVVWANKHLRNLGVTSNKKCYENHDKLGIVCPDCGVEKVFEQNVSFDVHEYKTINSKGETTWVEIRVTPLKDKDGNVTAALELALPITERKKAEVNLLKNKALLLEAEKAGKIGGWEFDINTLTQSWTDETFRILEIDLTHGEPIVPKGIEFINPPYRATANEAIQRAIEHGEPYDQEWEITTVKGNKRWVRSVAKANYENSKIKSISGSFQDITERKNSEKQIESLARFPFENPNMILRIDSNWKILYSNPASQQLANFIETEAGKSSPKSWKSHIKEALSNSKQIKFEESYEDRIFSFNFIPIVSEGYVNVYGTEITELKKTETHRKVLEAKVNNYSKHLKCMVDLRTVQLKDANERLVKSERLAAIGELAGMVGHDLRNPLAGIKNAAYFLKKKGIAISEAQAKEMLETIDKALEHSDKIINDLLDYAREMHLELTKYAAHTLVNEAMKMIQVPERIQIVNHVNEEVWIWVNADKMVRVFMNLIKNAVDAMPQKGTLRISSCQTKDCVEISFADTGTGIPEETMQKLFTPLFTTKAQGMGFGLAICKRIVEAHEGTISVETAVNKGTTFTITLPLKPNANVEC